ncbi:hypothetical protein [Diplocloster modestus]|uniref:ATP synthase F0 subunit 8 n=1 Tax=Diplocloster modestus TaxID=2850322 RepID=A0ABS6KEI9_9FIRM|nr:hypothetical protein [Diplocloster modestus]MBU9728947.1 hypothetical protein [Diplocloster modestus]
MGDEIPCIFPVILLLYILLVMMLGIIYGKVNTYKLIATKLEYVSGDSNEKAV